MRIAILGGTSQIATDLARSLAADGECFLNIYARQPEVVRASLRGGAGEHFSFDVFQAFAQTNIKFDAVINFVGAGNPARVITLGADIFSITSEFDQLALNYLKRNPECRYIFASSGAIYGGDFSMPVNTETRAVIQVNSLSASDWYGVAKLHAECRHRALKDYQIIDIRFFNYFSGTQDINGRYLVTDALRAVKLGQKLKTSSENLVRDYMGPEEVFSLICGILKARPINIAIDGYTKQAVDKFQLLNAMEKKFGLVYEIDNEALLLNATGAKKNYFSENYLAQKIFGYAPQNTALEIILQQAESFFS